jgi:uncharacterized membrane protein YdjX (TVP38/TMEM64 family)
MSISGILRSRWLWLGVAAASAAIATYVFDPADQFSLEALRQHRDSLTDWVDANVILASAAYLAIYVGVVAFSIPCAVVLTISGGFMFGPMLGAPLAVMGATVGAAVLFLLVRKVLGNLTIEQLGPRAAQLAHCLRQDAASYLLAMRFAPFFPFFLVNLVPAFVGVPLRTFVLTTLIGIIPITLVFSLAGAGLGAAIDSGAALTPAAMLTPEVLAGLALLALTSLASIPVRRWARRSAAG